MVSIATNDNEDPVNDRHADFVHTGPGTPAGRYMRMFWHPVYLARDLKPAHPMPVTIMSEDFTLYRGEAESPMQWDFAVPIEGHSSRQVGLRASVSGAFTMAGNTTAQASASNNRRRALLSRTK